MQLEVKMELAPYASGNLWSANWSTTPIDDLEIVSARRKIAGFNLFKIFKISFKLKKIHKIIDISNCSRTYSATSILHGIRLIVPMTKQFSIGFEFTLILNHFSTTHTHTFFRRNVSGRHFNLRVLCCCCWFLFIF